MDVGQCPGGEGTLGLGLYLPESQFPHLRVDGNDNGLLESSCGLHEMMSGRCFARSRGSGRTQGAAPDLDERGTQGQASSVTMSAV